MRLFVTGGTGFIGSHFINAALLAGHQITAIRRAESKPRVPLTIHPEWLVKPMDQIVCSDFKNCHTLVHLAATGVSPQKATWQELLYWNVDVPIHLFIAAAEAGIKRIVISGSFAEYGRSAEKFEFIPPNAPLEPTFPYAASKAASFVTSYALASEIGLRLAYLRIFSAFGEGQHPSNFWPSLRKAALAGSDFPMTRGEQIRDFVHVEQVAAQILSWATRPDWSGDLVQVRNIASGKPVKLLDFARQWWLYWGARGQLLPGSLPYRNNEVMRYIPLVTED